MKLYDFKEKIKILGFLNTFLIILQTLFLELNWMFLEQDRMFLEQEQKLFYHL